MKDGGEERSGRWNGGRPVELLRCYRQSTALASRMGIEPVCDAWAGRRPQRGDAMWLELRTAFSRGPELKQKKGGWRRKKTIQKNRQDARMQDAMGIWNGDKERKKVRTQRMMPWKTFLEGLVFLGWRVTSPRQRLGNRARTQLQEPCAESKQGEKTW